MSQADFCHHARARDSAGLPLAVSIHAESARLRAELAEDCTASGFRIAGCGAIAALLEGDARPLGEVVLLDCPDVDAAILAALARLDLRAAQAGVQLVVSTSLAGLEDVFGCLDQSGAQILVDPSRAERVLALLRMSEQIGEIARALDRLRAAPRARGQVFEAGVFRFESPQPCYRAGSPGEGESGLVRRAPPPAPDPRLVRRLIRQRQLRARFFDAALFADPAWDILLDLTAARAERKRVSVTSLCIASGVPPTTALRWIGQMAQEGLLVRVQDDGDRRRSFVALSEPAAEAMACYFEEVGRLAD